MATLQQLHTLEAQALDVQQKAAAAKTASDQLTADKLKLSGDLDTANAKIVDLEKQIETLQAAPQPVDEVTDTDLQKVGETLTAAAASLQQPAPTPTDATGTAPGSM